MMASLVSGSPKMEQLQESGGTGKVLRINEDMLAIQGIDSIKLKQNSPG